MKRIGLLFIMLFALSVALVACGGGGGGAAAPSDTSSYTVGGSVNGLIGTGLVLQDNNADDLTISADGSFTFATAVANGGAYAVTVKTQPANPSQTCTASNNTGTIVGANVTDVSIVCSTNSYTVGGTVSGLTGAGLILQNNAGDNLGIASYGTFTFATAVADGAAYSVTVKTQPAGQSCLVTNGTGTVSGANVMGVTVTCYNTFDTSFNTTGIVTHNGAAGGNSNDAGISIAIDANGKILVTGSSANAAGNNDMVIWRYNANGTLDTTFNSTGIVSSNGAAGGNGHDSGSSITVDANGKILVTGYSTNAAGNFDMVIWRYNSDGTLDTTFNSTGIVAHNGAAGGNGADAGISIALDANGKILVTGYSTNAAGNNDMVIWRYNANGTLDTTFNSSGIVVNNSAAGGNGYDVGRSIAIDANGKILVAGYSKNAAGNFDMVIWRYNANGTLDTAFNGTGIIVNNSAAGGNGPDMGFSIAIDANSKILVTGNSVSPLGTDMVIWRYNTDGTLDTSFNSKGFVTRNSAAGGNNEDTGRFIKVDANGKILVAGYLNVAAAGNFNMAVWKYNRDGTLDTTFNGSGFLIQSNADGYSMAIDANGKIVVAGDSKNTAGNYDMTIWRLNP